MSAIIILGNLEFERKIIYNRNASVQQAVWRKWGRNFPVLPN